MIYELNNDKIEMSELIADKIDVMLVAAKLMEYNIGYEHRTYISKHFSVIDIKVNKPLLLRMKLELIYIIATNSYKLINICFIQLPSEFRYDNVAYTAEVDDPKMFSMFEKFFNKL